MEYFGEENKENKENKENVGTIARFFGKTAPPVTDKAHVLMDALRVHRTEGLSGSSQGAAEPGL